MTNTKAGFSLLLLAAIFTSACQIGRGAYSEEEYSWKYGTQKAPENTEGARGATESSN